MEKGWIGATFHYKSGEYLYSQKAFVCSEEVLGGVALYSEKNMGCNFKK